MSSVRSGSAPIDGSLYKDIGPALPLILKGIRVMFVTIGVGSDPILDDANEFRSLKVVWTSPLPPTAHDMALIGCLVDEYVWLDPVWLRAQGLAHGPKWDQAFTSMVEFAHGKGWTNAAGFLRAHLAQLSSLPRE